MTSTPKLRQILLILFTSLSGISLVVSGHIAVGWLPAYFPQSPWFFTLAFGAGLAFSQVKIQSLLSSISSAFVSDKPLVQRSGNIAFYFGLRVTLIMGAAALLGSLLPFAWRIIIAPFLIKVGTLDFSFSETYLNIFISTSNFEKIELVVSICLLIIGIFWFSTRYYMERFESQTIKILLPLITLSILLTSLSFYHNELNQCGKSCSPLANHYLSHIENITQIERMLNQSNKTSNKEGSMGENLTLRQKNHEEILEAKNHWNVSLHKLDLGGGYSFIWQQSFDRLFKFSNSNSGKTTEGKNKTPLAELISSFVVGGWIFFSFFSIGDKKTYPINPIQRESILNYGGISAILIALIIFTLSVLFIHVNIPADMASSLSFYFESGLVHIPINSLHLYGLAESNYSSPVLYAIFSLIWIFGFIVLITHFIEFCYDGIQSSKTDLAKHQSFSTLALTTVLIGFFILGFLESTSKGLFQSQIAIYSVYMTLQAILIFLSCRHASKVVKKKHNRLKIKIYSYVFITLVLLMVFSFLFFYEPPHSAQDISDQFSNSTVDFLKWLTIFLFSCFLFGVYYSASSKFHNRKHGCPLNISYSNAQATSHSDKNLRILIINGLHGSRDLIKKAYVFSEQNNVDHLVFIGPLLANKAYINEELGIQNSTYKVFSIDVLKELVTLKPEKLDDVFEGVDSQERKEHLRSIGAYNLDVSQSNDDTLISNEPEHLAILKKIVHGEINWLKIQESIYISRNINSKVYYIPTTNLDLHYFENTTLSVKNMADENAPPDIIISAKTKLNHEEISDDIFLKVIKNEIGLIELSITDSKRNGYIKVDRSYAESVNMVATLIHIPICGSPISFQPIFR